MHQLQYSGVSEVRYRYFSAVLGQLASRSTGLLVASCLLLASFCSPAAHVVSLRILSFDTAVHGTQGSLYTVCSLAADARS